MSKVINALNVGDMASGGIVVEVLSAPYALPARRIIVPNATNANLEDSAAEIRYVQDVVTRDYDHKTNGPRKGSKKRTECFQVGREIVIIEKGTYTNIWGN